MKTEKCLDLLAASLATVSIASPEQTPLHRNAEAVLVMARAYESDGRTFLATGNPVNALASAWYGSGWLHFGIAYGLVETCLPAGCPFLSACEHLPASSGPALAEKTGRYRRLLDTARDAVKPAAEPETACHDFAEKILCIAAAYAWQGNCFRNAGTDEDALACFSYGHGWLDAGVTSGLFTITGHRDLFTV